MICFHRYAIDDSSMDWAGAEAQVAKLAKSKTGGGRSSVISVKSSTPAAGVKRKVENIGADGDEKKKTRRGKKAKR